MASWNLNPGFLKLFAWQNDFKPNSQKNTSAQVWVRIYGLAQDYWRPKIITAIASSIGSPITIDAIAFKPMFERTFGQYVRVLVDIDISQTLSYQVLVERKGYAFCVDLDYENLPLFCNHCNMVGHSMNNCKKIHVTDGGLTENEKRSNPKFKGAIEKVYVQKKDNRVQQGIENNGNKDTFSAEPEAAVNGNLITSPMQMANAVIEVELIQSQNRENNDDLAQREDLEQQNSFAALENVREEDAEIQPEDVRVGSNRNTENFIVGVDDTSHEDSAFVDTTQLINEEVSSEGEDSQQQITPARVQQDMEFLKASWANIAEDTEAERGLLQDLEQEDVGVSDGFKLVQNKKKAHKHKRAPANTPLTRSKVCQTKPFK